MTVIQLSVENAMANRAAATKLKMVANASVTALQKPMLHNIVSMFTDPTHNHHSLWSQHPN